MFNSPIPSCQKYGDRWGYELDGLIDQIEGIVNSMTELSCKIERMSAAMTPVRKTRTPRVFASVTPSAKKKARVDTDCSDSSPLKSA
jgi:hypothetical protein